MMTRLRRLFQRARMDQMEINILRGILTAVQKSSGATTTDQSSAGHPVSGQESDHV